MAKERFQDLLRGIRQIIVSYSAVQSPDAELVERFAAQRDELAFAELLKRYGPMVLGVCQRILADPNIAEDAFQATFCVFVRKVPTIGKKELVGNWLFGVARRVAMNMKIQVAKNLSRDAQMNAISANQSTDRENWGDMREVIDEEIALLPARYRMPVILCYLEGRTYSEAAEMLGCLKGTLAIRLSRARELLRGRLEKRGVTLSLGAFTAGLSQAMEPGRVSAALLEKALQASLGYSIGGGAAGMSTVAARAAADVLRSMRTMKMQYVAATLLAAGVLGAGAVTALQFTRPWIPDPLTAQIPVDAFGDPLPPHAIARIGTLRWRHDAEVTCVRFSGSRGTLISGSTDGRVCFWDAAGKEVARFDHDSAVVDADITPNDAFLLVACADDQVHIWDTKSRRPHRTFTLNSPRSLAATREGMFVAASADKIMLTDARTGKVAYAQKVHEDKTCQIQDMCLDNSGTEIATVSTDQMVRTWDVKTGTMKAKFLAGPNKCLDSVITALAYVPDDELLAVGNLAGLWLFDTQKGTIQRTFPIPNLYARVALAFSHNGKTLVSAGDDNSMRIWDVPSTRERGRLWKSMHGFNRLAFAPNGTILVSASVRDRQLRLWNPDMGKPLFQLPQTAIRGLAISRDTDSIAALSWDRTLGIWDSRSAKCRHFIETISPHDEVPMAGAKGALLFSSDGASLLWLDRQQVRSWDVLTGKEVEPISLPDNFRFTHLTDRRAFGLSNSGSVSFDFASRQIRHFQAKASAFAATTFAEIRAREIILWDADRGTSRLKLPTGLQASDVHLSDDGNILVYRAADETIHIVDVFQQKETHQLLVPAGTIRLSADGTWLAVNNEHRLHVYDVYSGTERLHLEAAAVSVLDFSRDGSLLASGDEDGCVTVWGLPESTRSR